MTVPILSLAEARVLGVLVEKQRTVPDTYPLSLNALVAGCNQKTSRHPVMELTEAQVQDVLDNLRSRSLVAESSGGRVMRYAHNADGVLRIPSQSLALLTVLLLRGPQTPGELRIASERMHNFADTSSVEAFLDEMAARPAGALVARLARLPGARESRWMHLLSGAAPEAAAALEAPAAADPAGEVPALRAQVQRLDAEVAALKAAVARLCTELGLALP